jgi:predicted  nucleic acid-binding Zn-ribbon protein
MKRLILILNGRGGVGKSFFAVNYVQFLKDIRSLEVTVQGFEERAEKLELDITDASKRANELGEKVGAKFEREDRFQELTRRQSGIEEKLDLAKNQAPSQMDAAVTDEREDNSERQIQTRSNKQTRGRAVQV